MLFPKAFIKFVLQFFFFSGVESLSPAETRCGSEHSEHSEHLEHSTQHSEAESETSDYPRSTPSPSQTTPAVPTTSKVVRTKSLESTADSATGSSRPCRRTTLPSLSSVTNLHNLKVSLVKLPVSTLKAHMPDGGFDVLPPKGGSLQDGKRSSQDDPEPRCKKVKLEGTGRSGELQSSSSHNSKPAGFKVLPKSPAPSGLNLKTEEEEKYKLTKPLLTPDSKPLLTADTKPLRPTDLDSKAASMKREIAKIDSILQNNLLLDKSTQKLNEILLFDSLQGGLRIKNEKEGFEEQVEEVPPNLPVTKTDSAESSEPNVGEEAAREEGRDEEERKVPEREFVKCRWRGCGLDVEDMHLLEHLNVSIIGDKQIKQTAGMWIRIDCIRIRIRIHKI